MRILENIVLFYIYEHLHGHVKLYQSSIYTTHWFRFGADEIGTDKI